MKRLFKKEVYVLGAIVGRQNTQIAILKHSDKISKIFVQDYLTRNIDYFPRLLDTVLTLSKDNYGMAPTVAAIGASGEILPARNSVKVGKLAIENKAILQNTGLKSVHLMTDYEAAAWGLHNMPDSHFVMLPHIKSDISTKRSRTGSIVIVGAGTDLGMSAAHFVDDKLHVSMPSIGNMTDFPVYSKKECDLLTYLKKKSKTQHHLTAEHVLSLNGLCLIFDYYSNKSKIKLVKEILKLGCSEKLLKIQENYARSAVCRKAIDQYMLFFARFCRNISLFSQCSSGLFIRKIAAIRNIDADHKHTILHSFMKEYENHNSTFLNRVPVYLVTNSDMALLGCCEAAVASISKAF